jgi:hypothetical protein
MTRIIHTVRMPRVMYAVAMAGIINLMMMGGQLMGG